MKKSRKQQCKSRRNWNLELLESRSYLSSVSFANHVDFADGTAPISIISGNFDTDTKTDIATADALGKTVNVFFGNGAGGFTAGPVLTLTAPPTSLAAGDFNHDGLTDLAVGASPGTGSSNATITVFLNNGNSTFGTGQITSVATATSGQGVALVAGDFDGNGNLDLASANFTAGTVSILLGNGIGTFATPVSYPVGLTPSSIVSGHFNNSTSLDLAVAGRRSVVGGGFTNVVTLLNGLGDGTFNTGADVPVISTVTAVLTTTDFNTDGLTDLVFGSLNDSVELLENTGSEIFTAQPLISTSGPIASVAVADFNFDQIPDIAAAQGGTVADPGNDNVAIATGIGAGTYSIPITLPTGSAPAALVVADFNGDHKLDIASANYEGGTVSVMLNTTAGTPQLPTSTTLATSAATAPFATNVDLTATVTGPSDAGTLPTGTVNFYQGSTLIGSAVIAGGTDQAVLHSTALPVGTDVIIARYQGDGLFSNSASSTITETITPTPGNGPDLVPAFISTTLPAVLAPGEKGTVKFRVTNQGNFAGKGLITNALYLSLDDTLDTGDIPITVQGSFSKANVNLAVGKFITLSGSFTVPAGASLGNYVLLADINTTATLLESETTNNTGASPTQFDVVNEFGIVGGKAGVVLQLTDSDGTLVSYKLTGPGTGTVDVGDNGTDLTLTGTTAASALTITGKGSDGFVTLNSLSSVAAIGAITAPTTNLTGDVILSGGVSRVKLNDFTNGNLIIGGTLAPTIQLGGSLGINLDSTTGIKSLAITGVGPYVPAGLVGSRASTIVAPWIGTLSTQGSFDATLTLDGVASPRGVVLATATIGANIAGSISLTGNVGKIVSHDNVAASEIRGQAELSVSGQIKSFTDNDFSGTLTAADIGSILIKGNLSGEILSGANFGADGVIGGGDDTFAAGNITSCRIIGSATSTALVVAGLNPVDDILLNGNDTLFSTGAIKSIVINGSADRASKFLATFLPKKVKIGASSVDPATDARFQL